MKIDIRAKLMWRYLGAVSVVRGGSVEFVVVGGRLYLQTADEGTSVRIDVPQQCVKEGEGGFSLSTSDARTLLRGMEGRGGYVTIEYKGDEHISVAGPGRGIRRLAVQPLADEGVMRVDFPSRGIEVPGDLLWRAMDQVYFAASRDRNDERFSGLYLQVGDGLLECAASDGYHLARARFAVDTTGCVWGVIIPHYVVESLLYILESSEPLHLAVADNVLYVRRSDVHIRATCAGLKYPDYHILFPASPYPGRIECSAGKLSAALKYARVGSPDGSVEIESTPDQDMTVKAVDEETGVITTARFCGVRGSAASVAVDADRLNNIVVHARHDVVILGVSDVSGKPVTIERGEADPALDWAALIVSKRAMVGQREIFP